ncbi:MAG: hypothetical protein LUH51_00555 [Firmicutes bacterium]|nr:hypothetical protein [Bacillota bacterium]
MNKHRRILSILLALLILGSGCAVASGGVVTDAARVSSPAAVSVAVGRILCSGLGEGASISDGAQALPSALSSIPSPASQSARLASSILNGVKDFLTGTVDMYTGLFTGDWELMWTGVQEILSGYMDVLTGILGALFIGIFTGEWEQFWTGIQDIFDGTWSFFADTL